MNKRQLDYSLCVITEAVPLLGRTHEDVAVAAIKGGARVIQFRDKTLGDIAFRETALRLNALVKKAGALLVINDRVDIAKECRACGLHIGQSDLALEKARQIMGSEAIIGVSVSSVAEAKAAAKAGADYLGAGPIFPTASKADAFSPIGLEGLADICRESPIPVIAIGGIDKANAGDAIAAGAAGIAVIAAVAEAPDMAKAATELKGCVI